MYSDRLKMAPVGNNGLLLPRYPGEIVPKVLYLGDWEHAQQTERLDELNIRRCAARTAPAQGSWITYTGMDKVHDAGRDMMSQCFASLPMARTLHRSHCHECGAGTCVRRVITIHNNPENMQLPGRFKHLRLQLADVDTQDVSKFFAPSYTFIEEARAGNEGVHIWTRCPLSTHYPGPHDHFAYCFWLLMACVFGNWGSC
jgi:hypothetical protein